MNICIISSGSEDHIHKFPLQQPHSSQLTATSVQAKTAGFQLVGFFLGRNFIAFFIITAADHHSTWVHDLSHFCRRQKCIYKTVAAAVSKSCLKSVGTLKLLIYVSTRSSFFPDLCWLISADLMTAWTPAQQVICRAHIRDFVFCR